MIQISPGVSADTSAAGPLQQIQVLENACVRVSMFRCTVKAGCIWQPEVYAGPDITQMFLFLNAGGYVAAGDTAFAITEPSLFVPNFDRETVTIRAGTSDLSCIRIVSRMNEEDCSQIRKSHMVFPRFRPFSKAWEHTMASIDAPGSNVRGFVLIENRKLGANNMGILDSGKPGSAFISESVLPAYDQFVIALDGADFTLRVGEETSPVRAEDIAFVPRGAPFSSTCGEDGRIHYVWFNLNRAYDT